jgi:membrane fusion protein (multidrug efflux system)
MHSTSAGTYAQQAKRGRGGGWLKRLIPLGLIVVAAAAVAFVALMPNEPADPPATNTPPVNVTIRVVRAEPQLADTFTLTAVVEPNRVVQVAAEASGRIETYGRRQRERTWRGRRLPEGATLQEGEPISQGDPLIHLDKDLLQAGFERARAQFDYDQREYRRLLDLSEGGATSQTELDDARTRRDIAKALLDEAAEQLERATITAPIDGVLNRLLMEVGEYATPGDLVAEIVDIDQAKVVVDVPERDVHYLAVGQSADVFVRSPQPRELVGEITYISELADEHTRTSRLEITVDNREHVLRAGQIVRACLTRRVLNDVVMIPLGAVIPLENGKVVYLADSEGRAERREVELGFIKGRSVQILSGLAEGDRLIVAGHRFVGPGQPVSVINVADEAPATQPEDTSSEGQP